MKRRNDIGFDYLKNLYEKEKMSTIEIAEVCNCSASFIRKLLDRYRIKRRDLSDANKFAWIRGRKNYTKEKHPKWKGGIRMNHGYRLILLSSHPRANSGGYVLEHILKWEEANNKKLPQDYIIHHLNGIRDDNRPENLIAITKTQHHRLRIPYQKRIRDLENEIKKLKQGELYERG